MSSDTVIETHYRRLAGRYDEFLRWSPDFIDRHARKMIDHLELAPDDQLVDLGCGTGIYPAAILELLPLRQPVIGVDPFEEMLAQIPDEVTITPVAEDAVEFTARPGTYDKVLMKETVHHIDRKDELIANVHERLRPGGIFLLVHVNPHLVEYPLFEQALKRCAATFADPNDLVALLEDAGFSVGWDQLAYPHSVPTEHYFEMVRNCYMSVLTSFEEDDLEGGLEEMAERYGDRDVLEFTETFDYLTARKR